VRRVVTTVGTMPIVSFEVNENSLDFIGTMYLTQEADKNLMDAIDAFANFFYFIGEQNLTKKEPLSNEDMLPHYKLDELCVFATGEGYHLTNNEKTIYLIKHMVTDGQARHVAVVMIAKNFNVENNIVKVFIPPQGTTMLVYDEEPQ
jgi:hypothetical protein